jgi:hypothetical protein
MSNFAVVENGIVLNTIVANSKQIAEEVTGKTCIEFTTEPASIGHIWDGEKFYPPQPYPSWSKGPNSMWISPIPEPLFDPENPKSYNWDESTLSWIEITE